MQILEKKEKKNQHRKSMWFSSIPTSMGEYKEKESFTINKEIITMTQGHFLPYPNSLNF